ncbi:MAG: type II 3-dehydroquinate dehydratase [Candidatus Sumerlaeia bacterium]
MRILILNGPNLNLLGQRERSLYGSQTLGELEQSLRRQGQSLGIEIECYQSNLEGYLIDALQRARNRCQGVVFNPGGYTHTSVALRDAIAAIDIPVIEVHMTNIHGREDFRRVSLTAGACVGQISGLGFLSYEMALNALVRMIKSAPAQPQAQAQPAQVQVRPDRERVEARPEGRPEGRPAEAREQREGFEGGERGEEGREGKRRRRGRRGGRGRRREGGPMEEGGAPREEEQRREQELPDASERYANLKGVTVRRGVDVLAQDETPEPAKTGVVTFEDAPKPEPAHEVVAAVQVPSRPAAPSKPAPEPPKHEAPAPAPAKAEAPSAPAAAEAEARPRKSRTRKTTIVRKTTPPKKRASTAKRSPAEHSEEEDD